MLPATREWILFLIFVELHWAQDDTCIVTQEGEKTRYSVPAFKGTDCPYGWSNSSDHVLANNSEHVEGLVVMKSNRSLLLKECSDIVIYRLQCVSEAIEKVLTCKTSCSQNANTHSAAGMLRKRWADVVSICLLCLFL